MLNSGGPQPKGDFEGSSGATRGRLSCTGGTHNSNRDYEHGCWIAYLPHESGAAQLAKQGRELSGTAPPDAPSTELAAEEDTP